MISFSIPLLGIKFSTNLLYAGVHWSRRVQYKNDIKILVRQYCKSEPVSSYPVEITYRFFFSTKALDTTNTAGMAKCIEDALRAIGVLKDDSPKYVRRTVLESASIGKTIKDYVEVEIKIL